jgi:hypothetical protein
MICYHVNQTRARSDQIVLCAILFQQHIKSRHLEGEVKYGCIFGLFTNFRLISVIMLDPD